MKSLRIFVLVLTLLMGMKTFASEQEPILIGALYNVTGAMSSIDAPALKGAKLAVKHLNLAGGVLKKPIELLAIDTKTDQKEAAAAARQLIAAGVIAATGYGDTTYVLAAAPFFQKSNVPFLTSGATHPDLPEMVGDYMFLASFGDDAQAFAIAEYLYNRKGARTAWILTNTVMDFTLSLSRFFKERFQELAGSEAILLEDFYTTGNKDYSTQITKLQELYPQPDILFISAIPSDAGVIVKQIRQAGITTIIASGDGFDTSLLVEIPKSKLADEIYFSTHQSYDNPAPEVQNFIKAYIEEYGYPPEVAFAALGYDAMMLLARAIERADSIELRAIRDALAQENGYEGITGVIGYREGKRVPEKSVAIIRVKKGKFEFVTMVTPLKKGNY